jgi:hypothetical protein
MKFGHVHIEYRDIRVKFVFESFYHFEIFFPVVGAYAPMCPNFLTSVIDIHVRKYKSTKV